eukprot:138318_1
MGNNHDSSKSCTSPPIHTTRPECKLHKYFAATLSNQSVDDHRRIVFVSLIGLYLSWRDVPFKVMNNALIVTPFCRKWIYHPCVYRKQLRSCFVSQFTFFSDKAEAQTFIKLLKWKDSQGLVIWMFDHCAISKSAHQTPHDQNSLVSAFWHHLSSRLTGLKDPITGNAYNPLQLDHKWWMDRDKYVIKYNVKPSCVLTELFFFTMKYRTMQEIIYQSNPDSLRPVFSYSCLYHTMTMTTDAGICTMYDTRWSNDDSTESERDDDDDGTWFISSNYNPDQF